MPLSSPNPSAAGSPTARREPTALRLLLVDLDGFKQICNHGPARRLAFPAIARARQTQVGGGAASYLPTQPLTLLEIA